MSGDTFTLFVVLPDEAVCTLRSLSSGINVEEVKAKLELTAGLPSHIYNLLYPDGEKLEDHQKLLMQENIKDGYILRVHILEHWDTLYNSICKNNIESVYHNGGVHLKGNMVINAEESGKVESAVYNRGCVALFMASYFGLLRMCNMLISVGVDINGSTQFGRTALHAAVSKDNYMILKYLIDHGAKIYITDMLGKSPLDVAQAFSSYMCEKNLKIMQLNLRGNNTMTKNSKIKYSVPVSCNKITQGIKASSQRPKSLVEDRGNKQTFSQRPRPQTQHATRQILIKSSQGNKTVAWITLQDSENHAKLSKAKHPGFHKFKNVTRMETLQEDSITCKPLPLLKKKSFLKFAADDQTVSRSTQTTPVQLKPDVSTTPLLFAPPSSRQNEESDIIADEMNTSFSNDERQASARTRSSRSIKLVSFSSKERPTYPDLTMESSRVMKRRINMVANRSASKNNEPRDTSTPQRSGVVHDRWAERRKISNRNVRPEISSSDNDSDEDYDSGNGSDANIEAYDAWIKKKQLESKRMPRKITRPIHDIIKIGSTEIGDGRNPPAEYNLTACKDWMDRRKQNRRVPNLERIKSMRDFMSQKKLLEEKRQKLLLNAISYDEWMSQEFDRKSLIRRILRADFEQLKAMEYEKIKSRAPHQITQDKWQSEVNKRDEMERKRKEIQQSYNEEKEKWRHEIIRSNTAAPNKDWIQRNASQPRVLMRSNSKGSQESDVKRAVEADRAYQKWMNRKHSDDVPNIQRQIQNEKDMITSNRQRRSAHMVAC